MAYTHPYEDYISQRIEKCGKHTSRIVYNVFNAIDNHGATGVFYLLLVYWTTQYKKFILCKCEEKKIQNKSKAKITKITELNKWDEIEPLDFPMYVYFVECENWAQDIGKCISLLHRNNPSLTKLNRIESQNSYDLSKRILFSFPLDEEKMGTSNSKLHLLDFLKKELRIYLPLAQKSLDAKFWKETSYREIIPNEVEDCKVAGTPCKYINVKIDIDHFNNIFCSVKDAAGNTKYTQIHQELVLKSKESRATVHDLEKEIAEILDPTNNMKTSIELKKGDTGLSYYGLFKDILKDAKKVVVQETYLTKDRHLGNLKKLFDLLSNKELFPNLNFFVLYSPNPETKCPQNSENARKIFDEAIKYIRNSCNHHGIRFQRVTDNTLHDRYILGDTGWQVNWGMGLDFLEELSNVPQEQCKVNKACSITYTRFDPKNHEFFNNS